MIIGFIGKRGSGKTLSMTKEAYLYYRQGYTIYANIKLNFPYEKYTLEDIASYANGEVQFKKVFFIIDEAHVFIDSRRSGSKKNLAISYFILQTRKRDVKLAFTTQYWHQVDKRLRDATEIIVECTFDKQHERVNIMMTSRNTGATRYRHYNAIPLYGMYDTTEIVSI